MHKKMFPPGQGNSFIHSWRRERELTRTSNELSDPGHGGAAQSHPAAKVHVVLISGGVGCPGKVIQTRGQRLQEYIHTHS